MPTPMPLLVPVINQEGMMVEFLELLRCGVIGWFRVGGTYEATSRTHDAADEEEAAVTLLNGPKLPGCVGKEAIGRDRSRGAVGPSQCPIPL